MREGTDDMPDNIEHTIDDLLAELEEADAALSTLTGRVLDHVPDLTECETPIGEAHAGLIALHDYLTDRKNELDT